MAKINVGVEVPKVKVFESKFEAGALNAAKSGIASAFQAAAKHAPGAPKNGGHSIRLAPVVEHSAPDGKLTATCKWEVFVIENGQKKMFPRVSMTKPASGHLPIPDAAKVQQADVNDVVASAVQAAVSAILKRLP